MTKDEFSGAIHNIMGNMKVSNASKEELTSKMRTLYFAYKLCEQARFQKGGNDVVQFENEPLPDGVENVYDNSWHYGNSKF